MFITTLLCLLALSMASFFLFNARARALAVGASSRLHSLPSYHGAYVALRVALPSIAFLLIWSLCQQPLIDRLVMSSLPAEATIGMDKGALDLILSEIKTVADGRIFGEPSPTILAAAEQYKEWRQLGQYALFAGGLGIAFVALYLAHRKLAVEFRARQRVERIVSGLMIFCSLVAILTTLGIVFSLLFEAYRFFELVPWHEFFFGLNWEPQIPLRADQVAGLGAFGAIPVFTGTLLIAVVAILVAGPIGLFSAIYLVEYAEPKTRAVIKPTLEILSGIPTVVYGFFAVLVVAPAITAFGQRLGIEMAPNSALAAGLVMGIMIVPFISSLSDDAIRAVPQAMRDGAYALGATKAETIVSVLLPAALPGIVGGFLLAISRAIGETMIVVMAAGLIANLTANPFEAVTTVTVQIVTLLIGDTEFDSPKTLAAFALGLVLFAVTLCLNVIALRIVRKYREMYE
ncbi:MAG: phosphate ABC transporter permease subunit PstC [Proteobacteria bacterium]|nr:MAG: phosphate ABC transporter permease subunit PstC [Pseudomonadota bacterium]